MICDCDNDIEMTLVTRSFAKPSLWFGVLVGIVIGVVWVNVFQNVQVRPEWLCQNDVVTKQPMSASGTFVLSTFDEVQNCSTEDLATISRQLPTIEDLSSKSRCPESKWLDLASDLGFYVNSTDNTFVAINIGCNKGLDAVQVLRRGKNDPSVSALFWSDAMSQGGHLVDTACGGKLVDSEVNQHRLVRSDATVQVHCVEPMPSTFSRLQATLNWTQYGERGLQVHQYAISNPTIAGSILFPNKGAGEEASGVQNCDHFQLTENKAQSSEPPECVLVPYISLDDFAATHLSNVLEIHHLLIDTEGSDYLVLQGGSKTLSRTRYLEFEVNSIGPWSNQSLAEAVEYLDTLQFNCYWAGVGNLWKITRCHVPLYSTGKDWSNIACAHRILAPGLALIMEDTFLRTLLLFPSAMGNNSY